MIKKLIGILFFTLSIILNGCVSPDKDGRSIGLINPESQGISSKAILEFLEAAERERRDDLHGIIILRHGQKIAEGYWAPYNAESPHMLFSLSKSFTSSAIGIAQDEGLLSIYDPVISYFPKEMPDSVSINLKAMRIKDLLRMTTGHDRDATGRMQSGGESWTSNFLSLEVEHLPGTHFVYNTAATYMLSAIVQKASGETLLQYLKPRLFDPLDIINPTWEVSPEGFNTGGYGLKVRTRDIVSFGQLYLQKGNWNGKQLISEAWIDEATSLQTSNGSNPDSDWNQGYGYQFWRCRHNLYRGDGAFGQYCIVMPQYDAVVAINSGTNDMQAIMDLVWDHILPAFKDEALPADEESYNALKEKLSGLSISTVEGENASSLAESVSNQPYVMKSNETGIVSIKFDLTSEDKSITFTSKDESLKIPVGYGSVKQGEMLIPRYGKQVVASSGAWISESNYRVKMCYYETPFIITFDFIFGDKILTMNADMNVSMANRRFLELTGEKVE